MTPMIHAEFRTNVLATKRWQTASHLFSGRPRSLACPARTAGKPDGRSLAMKNRLFPIAVFFFFLLLLISPALAQESCTVSIPCPDEPGVTATGDQVQPICMYFFYGQGCPHCERVKPVIDALAVKYPQVQLKTYEIYFNTTNQKMFKEFLTRYGVTEEGVPTLFIGDRALVGETAIKTQLEDRIVWYTHNSSECPATFNKVGGLPYDLSPAKPVDLTLPSILIAAVIDSINPCAFAVLIFLLAYLTSLGERRRIALVGCTYIATVFVVYFIAGLGLLTVVQQTGLTGIVFTFAAVVAIVAGLINIAEVLLKREIFTLAIPVSQKGAIERYIRRASIPSAIALGALVSMVELPCTGGIYLAILGLLGDRMTVIEGIPYLLLYNLIFVLPLILILILMYWGGTPERLEAFRSGSKRWVRLVMGIVMIALGAAMLTGVI
ncbi:MAG: cytochrome c biogenesis protein CcdA [Methanomicrobiales archaeon]